jgi:hypothetical protein
MMRLLGRNLLLPLVLLLATGALVMNMTLEDEASLLVQQTQAQLVRAHSTDKTAGSLLPASASARPARGTSSKAIRTSASVRDLTCVLRC